MKDGDDSSLDELRLIAAFIVNVLCYHDSLDMIPKYREKVLRHLNKIDKNFKRISNNSNNSDHESKFRMSVIAKIDWLENYLNSVFKEKEKVKN